MKLYKCNCGFITNEIFKGCPSCGVESKKEVIEQYNYKKNLEHLRERYLNKIKWLEDRINLVNRDNYFGVIDGLKMVIHDLDDMLDGLDV